MSSRAMRVATVGSCVHAIVVMLMFMLVIVRFRLGFDVRNMNRVLVLMVTVMALHIACSVRAD